MNTCGNWIHDVFQFLIAGPLLQSSREMCLEPYQLSKMEFFVKKVNSFQPLTILAKSSILDIWQGSEYVSLEPQWMNGWRLELNRCK